MIDPKLLRSDLASIAKQLKVKGFDLDCKAFLALESERKALQLQAESLQQERNVYAKSMGKLMGEAKAKGEDVEPLKLKGEKLKNDSAAADVALADVQDMWKCNLESPSEYQKLEFRCKGASNWKLVQK